MGTMASFPGVKRPGRETDHSPPYSTEVKEWLNLYLNSPNTPSWRGAQLKQRDNFTSYIYLVTAMRQVNWLVGILTQIQVLLFLVYLFFILIYCTYKWRNWMVEWDHFQFRCHAWRSRVNSSYRVQGVLFELMQFSYFGVYGNKGCSDRKSCFNIKHSCKLRFLYNDPVKLDRKWISQFSSNPTAEITQAIASII
jgi:hypothetical protein